MSDSTVSTENTAGLSYADARTDSPAVPPPEVMTRGEIGAIACRVIALWLGAQGVSSLISLASMSMSVINGGGAPVGVILQVLASAVGPIGVAAGMWLYARPLGRQIVGGREAPVTSLAVSMGDAMSIAFAAVGLFWLVQVLQRVGLIGVMAAAKPNTGVLASSPELLGNLVLGGLSVWLILGSGGLARAVLMARGGARDRA